ncbi:unnamed protein product [Mycena citricolor]|uniref:Uncharacterized protein n=1 Tax=Mycena citricolor TaxID=2018698 RepID=A0AAD2H0H9_9AGAR|nr:unnamed protein product [Mycena citricolor]CAK5281304.1 unnamed protein product [Mycena citricolor]
MDYVTAIDADVPFPQTSSGTVRSLSHQIKGRINMRRHFRLSFDPHAPDDSDDEEEEEEEENAGVVSDEEEYTTSDSDMSSSSAASEARTLEAAHAPSREMSPNIYQWNKPRTGLLDLPLELIEHIATSIRQSRSLSVMDAGAYFVADKYHDFAEARFSLSSLTKVNKFLRSALERLLYRNILVDFSSWKGRKHTAWPAGSLVLLLQTLHERPELGTYVHIAAVDFQNCTDGKRIEDALQLFLLRCPNLNHLFLSQCPVAFWTWTAPISRLTGFATAFAPGILMTLFPSLSSLRDLHLRDCHVMALQGPLPSHNIKRLRLDSSHEDASAHFNRVLTICADSVTELQVRFIGGLQLRAPRFTERAFIRPGGDKIHTLRLDNLSVLSHPASGYAQLLRDMPALEHLHLSHHGVFARNAFRALPDSLTSLTVSEYYGLWASEHSKKGFVAGLAQSVLTSGLPIARVEGANVRKKEEMKPLIDACREREILFEKIGKAAADDFIRVIFGRRIVWNPLFIDSEADPVKEDPVSESDDSEEA